MNNSTELFWIIQTNQPIELQVKIVVSLGGKRLTEKGDEGFSVTWSGYWLFGYVHFKIHQAVYLDFYTFLHMYFYKIYQGKGKH